MNNGYLSLSSLVPVGDGEYLEAGTAADFEAMRAECLDDTGVWLIVTPDGGGYRNINQQWAAWNYFRQHGSPIAAVPGESAHGWGRAVDIWNWRAATVWLEANCNRFGFDRNTPSEGWHFNHPSIAPTTVISRPLPAGAFQEEEEENMNRIICVQDSKNGRVVKGQRFIQGEDLVLRPMPGRQFQIDSYCHPTARWVEWTGDDIVNHSKVVGFALYVPDLGVRGGVGKPTGEITYKL